MLSRSIIQRLKFSTAAPTLCSTIRLRPRTLLCYTSSRQTSTSITTTSRYLSRRSYSSNSSSSSSSNNNNTPMAAPSDTIAATESTTDGIITPESLTSTLRAKLSTSHVDIQDMSGGCGQAFNADIVSEQFTGKTALARHRLVNGALKTETAAIHAWTPRCLTPEQWEKEKGKGEER